MTRQLVNTRKRKGLPVTGEWHSTHPPQNYQDVPPQAIAIMDWHSTYKHSFAVWLTTYHPKIKLKPWQIQALNIILTQPRGEGKTELIKLLAEYDRQES